MSGAIESERHPIIANAYCLHRECDARRPGEPQMSHEAGRTDKRRVERWARRHALRNPGHYVAVESSYARVYRAERTERA